tara:strand:- start:38 stop:544 length:507 start_codon:yes stop_codon:yes gene_type:complete
MAKVIFQIDPPTIKHVFKVDPGPDYKYSIDPTDQDNYTVVDSDIDETAVHFFNLQLSADKSRVELKNSSETFEETKTKWEAHIAAEEIVTAKASRRDDIKATCKSKLEVLEWKWQRAQEQDLINGNNVAKTAVASERQAIRDANNAKEVQLDALTTLAEIVAFDPTDF